MTTSRCILVVDDDRDIREILADILEDEGYSVCQAANGADALDLLKKPTLPCVILLDLMMPVMDGSEFRNVQLADPRLASIPVVLFTADGNALAKGEKLGVADVLMKPIRLEDLMKTVGRICSHDSA